MRCFVKKKKTSIILLLTSKYKWHKFSVTQQNNSINFLPVFLLFKSNIVEEKEENTIRLKIVQTENN